MWEFSNDSHRDRKLDEMGKGDSHFIQKQNFENEEDPTTLLPLGTLPFNCRRMSRENDPSCVKVKEAIQRTTFRYHTLVDSKLSQCPVFEVFKKKIVTVNDVKWSFLSSCS